MTSLPDFGSSRSVLMGNSRLSGTTTTPAEDAALAGARAGLTQTQTTAEGMAAAQKLSAQGALAEKQAYITAGDISGENAKVAGIAGDVLQYQQHLDLMRTEGSARAAEGASGVAFSGSALDVMRSSMQQGALGEQLIQMQTALQQGGFLEQQAATGAESAAADAQYNQDLALSDMYSKQAAQASSELEQLQSASTSTAAPRTLGNAGISFKVSGVSNNWGGPTENWKS